MWSRGSLVEADRLTGVELIGGPVIPRTAVFIRPVNQPHPHRQGFVIPDDYDSDELPLWRMRVQPRTQGLWPKDPVRIGRSVPHGVT